MSVPTAEDYKALILAEVNDDDNHIVANNLDLVWGLYSDRDTLELTYLYAKRKAIDLLLGAVREKVTTEIRGGNVQVDNNALSKNLLAMRVVCQAHIDEIEAGTNTGSSGWGKTPLRA